MRDWKHWGWAAALVGLLMVGASLWITGSSRQWWGDALLGVGTTIALVAPILWITNAIQNRTKKEVEKSEERTTKQIGDLEEKVEAESADLAELKRTMSESQAKLDEKLKQRRARNIDRVTALRLDTSRGTVLSSLQAAQELSLLSKIGVRGSTPISDFVLRLNLLPGDAIRCSIDHRSQAPVIGRRWHEGKTLEDVMLDMAAAIETTSIWEGDGAWNFVANIDEIGATFEMAIDLRSRGATIINAVQLIGDEWLITDDKIISVKRPQYEIGLHRLGEQDWEQQLSTKPWVDEAKLPEMLEAASVIWSLTQR